MQKRYQIQFPPQQSHHLGQDEVTFLLTEDGQEKKIRFHDYDEIYLRPGLYEQIFYERLKCSSPERVGKILNDAMGEIGENLTELRVLDLGAGNGIMGEVLKRYGVARLVGADIIPQAKQAAYRDRPDVYDEYYVADFTDLNEEQLRDLDDWSINCLTSVAALGFGDIPYGAFFQALQLVRPGGWVAFNIKESFLDHEDNSGFSRLIRQLIFSKYLNLHHLEKYRHRLSMEGVPLYYFALVAQKKFEIPNDFLISHEIEG
ncbi:Trans-aconitate 2-methyltransferase [Thalassoglobus neptunius]|uniref:Trans-aconitate 2-methyltransferase n=1 Tax=Thalassoglobus neptunius TaxID=1938619 RepID=A0A5C5VPC3_9PLAN|nr:class I SAM-dependent methyltransferase [Thalassoglobus neptunius]TWT39863.1 Trans-aconitate 2-methyltransferase [Thalassoglobus neptunius]